MVTNITSINTRIAVQLVSLIIAAVVLQYLASVLIYSHVMTRVEKRSFISKIESVAKLCSGTHNKIIFDKPISGFPLSENEYCIVPGQKHAEGELDDREDSCWFLEPQLVHKLVTEAASNMAPAVHYIGSEWRHLSYRHTEIVVIWPLVAGDVIQEFVIGKKSFLPGLEELSTVHGYLLAFVVLNSILIATVGYFRMARSFIRPLNKLTERVQGYSEDGNLLLDDDNSTAFTMLSTRLNSMLRRIENDKRALQKTVQELEQSNKELEANKKLLIRSETLASVGRFSAGMAHEIGNPIAIVQGYVELLGDADLSPVDRKQFTDRANGELSRIRKLLEQLLQYARSGNYGELEDVDIHAILQEVVSFLRVEKKFKHIRIIQNLAAAKSIIKAHSDGLKQVMINCLLNSADACSDSHEKENCEITLETQNIVSSDHNPQQILSLHIYDNGPGIDQEFADKVFDPFFTTKAPGKGTGLGLYVCHTIVTGFGGTIEMKNRENGGCEIIIQFSLVATLEDSRGLVVS